MALWWLALAAYAADGTLEARLAEVAPLRALRLVQGVPVIPDSAYAEVEAGEIPSGLESVEGYAARKAWAATVVDVPIEKYWAAINDDPGKVKLGLIQHAKVVEGAVCGPDRTVFQYLPVSLVTDRWWFAKISVNQAVSDRTGGRVREMKWQSVDYDLAKDPEVAAWAAEGMAVESTVGAWWLVDLGDGRTLVEYYVWSDPGGAVPASMASRFAAGSISDTLTTMASAAKAGPGCPAR